MRAYKSAPILSCCIRDLATSLRWIVVLSATLALLTAAGLLGSLSTRRASGLSTSYDAIPTPRQLLDVSSSTLSDVSCCSCQIDAGDSLQPRRLPRLQVVSAGAVGSTYLLGFLEARLRGKYIVNSAAMDEFHLKHGLPDIAGSWERLCNFAPHALPLPGHQPPPPPGLPGGMAPPGAAPQAGIPVPPPAFAPNGGAPPMRAAPGGGPMGPLPVTGVHTPAEFLLLRQDCAAGQAARQAQAIPDRVLYIFGDPLLAVRSHFEKRKAVSVFNAVWSDGRPWPGWSDYARYVTDATAAHADLLGIASHMESWLAPEPADASGACAPTMFAQLETLVAKPQLLAGFLGVDVDSFTDLAVGKRGTVRAGPGRGSLHHGAPGDEPEGYIKLYDDIYSKMVALDGFVRMGSGVVSAPGSKADARDPASGTGGGA